MFTIITWIYAINTVLLLNHEMDTVFMEEYQPRVGRITYLIFLSPVLFLMVYGLISLNQQTFNGLVFSLLMGLAGISSYLIHKYQIRKGQTEFKNLMSLSILNAILIVSVIQTMISGFFINFVLHPF